jgi:excisionase family DNA binding protein
VAESAGSRVKYRKGTGTGTVPERVEALMTTRAPEAEPLLTPAEVAAMFRVDPKTVTRWAKAGKLSSIRTLGGHRRYRESEVRALLQGQLPTQRSGSAES